MGQKQSRSSYMVRGVLLWLSTYEFAKLADFEFSKREGTKVGRAAGWVTSLEDNW